jgi:hypothetical protein
MLKLEKQRYKVSKNQLYFNFYGIQVSVVDQTERFSWVLHQVVADFNFFSAPVAEAHVQIAICESMQKPRVRTAPVFSTRMCQVREGLGYRVCRYLRGTEVYLNGNSASCFGEDAAELYQSIYYFILSRVGELLELKGLHRIHAVTIQNGKTICFPMDSFGGKTSIALETMSRRSGKVLGDELAITNGVSIFPFPIRIGVRADVYSKSGTSLPAEKIERIGAGLRYMVSIPLDQAGAESSDWTLRLPLGWSHFSFAWRFIIGFGVPQMREFFIRRDNIFAILRIVLFRCICLLKLWKKISTAALP